MFCHAIEKWESPNIACIAGWWIDRRVWMQFKVFCLWQRCWLLSAPNESYIVEPATDGEMNSVTDRNCSRKYSKFYVKNVQCNRKNQNSLSRLSHAIEIIEIFLFVQSTLKSSWPDLKIPVFWRHLQKPSSVFFTDLTISRKVKFQREAFKYRRFAYPRAKCFVDFQFFIVFDIQSIETSHSACCRLAVSFT